MPGILTPDGVSLHAPRVGRGLQQAVLAGDGTDPTERPVAGDLDIVPALSQFAYHLVPEPRLDLDLQRLALARIERARKVVRVEGRRVDRALQVQPAIGVLQKEVERPLILLVASGRTERQVWIAAAERERRRERRARALAGLERIRQPLLEPEHL